LAIEPRQSQRDRLYQEAINPVTGTGGDGFVLFGDKTATKVPTPFDRINVRRLFNMLKTNIGNASKYRLFEMNDNFTRSSFRMETSQYLSGIKSLGGVYEFRVVCDTTNNTPAVIDRNEFVASFYIKPARSINYITLNFVATATGADFDELIGPQAQ
jgi:phage tail sheath protein FI